MKKLLVILLLLFVVGCGEKNKKMKAIENCADKKYLRTTYNLISAQKRLKQSFKKKIRTNIIYKEKAEECEKEYILSPDTFTIFHHK